MPLTKWKGAASLVWLGAGVSVHAHVLTHRHTSNTHLHAHTQIHGGAYRWCSALRSSPGGTGTSRPCRFRVWCRAGCTHAGHSLRRSSPPHSDKLRPYTLHGSRSQLSTPLKEARKIWVTNIFFFLFVALYFAICQMWHSDTIQRRYPVSTDLVACRSKDVWMSFLDVWVHTVYLLF